MIFWIVMMRTIVNKCPICGCVDTHSRNCQLNRVIERGKRKAREKKRQAHYEKLRQEKNLISLSNPTNKTLTNGTTSKGPLRLLKEKRRKEKLDGKKGN